MSLFIHRAYWRWSAGVQFARLPSTMAPLAFTLLTTATTGSYRLGGVLMSVYVAAEMVCAVPVGRLLDRIGPSRGLPVLLLLTAAGYGVLALAAGAPAPVLIALVLLPGIAGGALSGGFRTLLADTVDDELLPRAISVDAMLLEGVLIGGPALVALLDLAGTFVPLAAMAVVCLAAALLVPRGVGSRDRVESEADVPPARLATYLPWLGCAFTVGLLLSTIEVAPLPLVQRLGAPETAAPVVIAVLSGASIAGSALYAWRGKTGDPRLFLAGFVAGGLTLAGGLGWAGLLGSVALIGACTGPLVAATSVNLQRLLPKNRRSAGFSLSFTVQAAGFGLGSLAVGVLPLWLPPLFGVFAAAIAGAMLVRKPARAIGTMSVTS
ncbi:major facilitator transporter [Amycolatopsis mediterranei S699]|uniref:Major facilitator transporter n=2 Tax=Amycolatopsis mediterranei TaxID=33910 RepID=A0A0H3DM45_AMYMU|nr:MFS transporter [Amycolatopsis mediterranei]ADJ50744.1 major facilitator transporter [Amycolatopsis mediterranei U32]AEK47752.1 major facilitator transporter [Amycolatopsis mediterranei S699]AFO82449.1 major facilitator transporter [Amycolatopsis mediterranei S699]AGT89578.1 major facilitator transporter [Amycolatopsis mediterranei RB]KDO12264.1 MFS transporter [Amycolatopsis mediterranei]